MAVILNRRRQPAEIVDWLTLNERATSTSPSPASRRAIAVSGTLIERFEALTSWER